jgi:uncharacterized protein (TIGR02421 family)
VNKKSAKKPEAITDRFIRTVCARLAENKQVRRNLPGLGRVHVDRALPFLCVYRRPLRRKDDGTDLLVTSEAAYLTASGRSSMQPGLTSLVKAIARTMGDQFGAFLVVELWSGDRDKDESQDEISETNRPGFRILAPPHDEFDDILESAESALLRKKFAGQKADVRIQRTSRCAPGRLSPVLPVRESLEMGCFLIGLEVRPIYRGREEGEIYPLILRRLRRWLSLAQRRVFFDFTRRHTTHRPEHFQVLGRRAMVKAVWEVDKQLAEVSDRFDFLLQVTPVDAEPAWHRFQKSRFDRTPTFHYRPLPVDPVILKRRLYQTPVERVEDPALALLFRQKQTELDRQLTMLLDINSERFRHGSLQLYGGVDDDLAGLAGEILLRLPARTRENLKSGYVDAATFAKQAEGEIAYYRKQLPEMNAGVQVRGDIASGLMVSRGSLLIGAHSRFPASRVEPLLQHEIGTHVLTYYNGKAQPFRQLYSGLAGYESLQEGLAVLAEYLVGGLSRPRIRLLAARVLAAGLLINGASFVDTFRELNGRYGFERRTAFMITMRIYRGGGLTKDAIYLHGLNQMLDYLGKGGKLPPLFIGKVAAEHVPIIRELQWRNVLRDPSLTPRYMEKPEALARLDELRQGMRVIDLIERR